MTSPSKARTTDVIVVGAGPIGLELAAALKRAAVDYLHLEARQIGHTISWWPREERYTLFIENSHIHVGSIVKALTGRWPDQLGTIPARSYELPLDAIQAN